MSEIKLSYCCKICNKPIWEVILLCDNTRFYIAAVTIAELKELSCTSPEHLPHCFGVLPCDFHIFGPMKEILWDQKFNNNLCTNLLLTQPISFCDNRIKKKDWTAGEGSFLNEDVMFKNYVWVYLILFLLWIKKN